MSRSVLILLILLVLWIIFGAWLCKTKLVDNNSNAANGPCDGEWSIEYKGQNFDADGFISFPKSGDKHKATSASINSMIDKTANYLKKNSSEKLTILGYFDEDESYGDKELVYLGLARANDVKKMLTNKGVSASQLNVKPMQWETNCFNGNTLIRGAEFKFGK